MGISIKNITFKYDIVFILLILIYIELFFTLCGMIFGLYPPSSVLYVSFFIISIVLLNKKLLSRDIFIYYILLTPIFLYSFFQGNSITSIVTSSRILLCLPFILLLKESSSIKISFILVVYTSCFLVINLLFGTKELISFFKISEYYESRNISSYNGVPFGFLTKFANIDYLRSWVGILAADKSAYIALASISSTLYLFKKYSKGFSLGNFMLAITLPLFIIEIFFVKTALLVVLVVLLYNFLYKFKKSHYFVISVISLTLIISVCLVLKFVSLRELSSSGAISHINGLVGPILNCPNKKQFLFGKGMGSGGTLGGHSRNKNLSDQNLHKSDIGGESTFGAYFYQIGLLGVVYLLIVNYYLFCNKKNSNIPYLYVIFIASLFSEAVTSIISLIAIANFVRYFLNHK